MEHGVDLGLYNVRIERQLGRGGFSVVYAGRDHRLDRPVAVKVLDPLADDRSRRLFDAECRALGRLSLHPNIVTVYDSGFGPRGEPYLLMEMVDGGSLAGYLEGAGRLAWAEALDIIIPIGHALAYAHQADIIHRDVKPENILLANGEPRLADFGIADLREATGKASTSVTASFLHTAPETFSTRRDERSDVYSLASTLYEALTGHGPFWRPADDSIHQLMYRVINEPAPPITTVDVPAELDALLQQALAKDPADRPRTAADFTAELERIRQMAPPAPATRSASPPDLAALPRPGAIPAWPSPGGESPDEALPISEAVIVSSTPPAGRRVPAVTGADGWRKSPASPGGSRHRTRFVLIGVLLIVTGVGAAALLQTISGNDEPPADDSIQADSDDTDDPTAAASADLADETTGATPEPTAEADDPATEPVATADADGDLYSRANPRFLAMLVESGPFTGELPQGLVFQELREASIGDASAAQRLNAVQVAVEDTEADDLDLAVFAHIETYEDTAQARARWEAQRDSLVSLWDPGLDGVQESTLCVLGDAFWTCTGVRGYAYAEVTLSPNPNATRPIAVALVSALLSYADEQTLRSAQD
jgi:serine/threonine protein kinase